MVTLYDICRVTELSTATVSRVINKKEGLVTEKTRKKVEAAIKKLGYRPNIAAQMLAGGKSNVVSVIFPEIDDGFYVQVLRGIDDAVSKAGMHIQIAFFHSLAELRDDLLKMAHKGHSDVGIVMNNTIVDHSIQEYVDDDYPLVLLGHSEDAKGKFDVVGIDNMTGARSIVSHLIKNGSKRILVISGPNNNSDSIERLNGVKQAFGEAGLEFSNEMVREGDFTYDGGRKLMAKHIDSDESLPDTILALNDQMALGVLDVLKESDYKVPEDVAVAGFDGSEISRYAELTTVAVPMRDLGYEAASLAIRRISQDGYIPTTITVNTKLIVRETA